MLSTRLSRFRASAATASGGTSSDWIYDGIGRALSNAAAGGRLLEIGAGMGHLTRRLKDSGCFTSILAADIMDRPNGLPSDICWIKADVNEGLPFSEAGFDTIVCCEVIEHLENPRALLREIYRLLSEDGLCVISTPNCENIRSFISLYVRGHHWAFGPHSYPAHLTPLTRLDLERCFLEAGLADVSLSYTNQGGVPGSPKVTWQQISFGLLRGLRYSDNIIVSGRKKK